MTLKKAIIHCSATPEGRDVDIEDIRQWHLARGWRDVGYHFVIKLAPTKALFQPQLMNVGTFEDIARSERLIEAHLCDCSSRR